MVYPQQYTLLAIENFIQKLLVDQKIARYCKDWFYSISQPQQFASLLFSIGFIGVKEGKQWAYKTTGGDAAFMPSLTSTSTIRIHPAYHSALHLREMVLPEISDDTILKVTGILEDLPEGVTFDDYNQKLQEMLSRLEYIVKGPKGASEFEEFVGEVIKLCFFRTLTNAQPKSRNNQGVTIKDWITSNRAPSGFWEVIRSKYDATQIVWECKNYDKLSADDFHQTAYYMNDVVGRFVVMVCRAQEIESSYYRHIERIAKDKHGMVLILTEKDLRVFIRQAIKGKVKEDHINEIFDRTLRSVG